MFGYFAGAGGWGELLTFLLFGLVGPGRAGPARPQLDQRRAGDAGAAPGAVSWRGWSSPPSAWPCVAGLVSGAAFDSRYIAVVFPLFVLLCALG